MGFGSFDVVLLLVSVSEDCGTITGVATSLLLTWVILPLDGSLVVASISIATFEDFLV